MSQDSIFDTRRRWALLLSHAIVIVILFVLPDVLLGMSRPGVSPISKGLYFKPATLIVVFYINYAILIPRYLMHRMYVWRFVVANVVLLGATTWLGHLAWTYSHIGGHHRRGGGTDFDIDHTKLLLKNLSFVIRDGVMIVLTMALAVALRLSEKWRALKRHHEELMNEQRATELQSLKSQLNPHFLFNTLNNIYALISISPEQAQEAVHRLSQMLRYVIYENPERVELHRELDFVRNYVELMRLRISKRRVELNINDGGHGDSMIAPLLFVTLIENAFKHGTSSDDSAPICIDITVDENMTLTCRTCNAVNADAPRDDDTSGIGIANLRKRLGIIYDDGARLTTKVANGMFIATLTVNMLHEDLSASKR